MEVKAQSLGRQEWMVRMNDVPDATDGSSSSEPLIFSARSAQMGRPRRSPSARSHCEENGVKRSSRSASGIPGPESVTIN